VYLIGTKDKCFFVNTQTPEWKEKQYEDALKKYPIPQEWQVIEYTKWIDGTSDVGVGPYSWFCNNEPIHEQIPLRKSHQKRGKKRKKSNNNNRLSKQRRLMKLRKEERTKLEERKLQFISIHSPYYKSSQ